jgi:predicted nuclease with TOPRIM domain
MSSNEQANWTVVTRKPVTYSLDDFDREQENSQSESLDFVKGGVRRLLSGQESFLKGQVPVPSVPADLTVSVPANVLEKIHGAVRSNAVSASSSTANAAAVASLSSHPQLTDFESNPDQIQAAAAANGHPFNPRPAQAAAADYLANTRSMLRLTYDLPTDLSGDTLMLQADENKSRGVMSDTGSVAISHGDTSMTPPLEWMSDTPQPSGATNWKSMYQNAQDLYMEDERKIHELLAQNSKLQTELTGSQAEVIRLRDTCASRDGLVNSLQSQVSTVESRYEALQTELNKHKAYVEQLVNHVKLTNQQVANVVHAASLGTYNLSSDIHGNAIIHPGTADDASNAVRKQINKHIKNLLAGLRKKLGIEDEKNDPYALVRRDADVDEAFLVPPSIKDWALADLVCGMVNVKLGAISTKLKEIGVTGDIRAPNELRNNAAQEAFELRQSLQILQRENERLNVRVRTDATSYQQLRDEHARLLVTCDTIRQNMDLLQQKLNTAQNETAASQQAQSRLNAQIQQLQQNLSMAQKETAASQEARTQLERGARQLQQDLKDEKEASKQAQSRLNAQIQQLQQNLQAVNASLGERLQAADETNRQISLHFGNVQQNLKRLQAEKATLEKEYEDTRQQLTVVNATSAEKETRLTQQYEETIRTLTEQLSQAQQAEHSQSKYVDDYRQISAELPFFISQCAKLLVSQMQPEDNIGRVIHQLPGLMAKYKTRVTGLLLAINRVVIYIGKEDKPVLRVEDNEWQEVSRQLLSIMPSQKEIPSAPTAPDRHADMDTDQQSPPKDEDEDKEQDEPGTGPVSASSGPPAKSDSVPNPGHSSSPVVFGATLALLTCYRFWQWTDERAFGITSPDYVDQIDQLFSRIKAAMDKKQEPMDKDIAVASEVVAAWRRALESDLKQHLRIPFDQVRKKLYQSKEGLTDPDMSTLRSQMLSTNWYKATFGTRSQPRIPEYMRYRICQIIRSFSFSVKSRVDIPFLTPLGGPERRSWAQNERFQGTTLQSIPIYDVFQKLLGLDIAYIPVTPEGFFEFFPVDRVEMIVLMDSNDISNPDLIKNYVTKPLFLLFILVPTPGLTGFDFQRNSTARNVFYIQYPDTEHDIEIQMAYLTRLIRFLPAASQYFHRYYVKIAGAMPNMKDFYAWVAAFNSFYVDLSAKLYKGLRTDAAYQRIDFTDLLDRDNDLRGPDGKQVLKNL